MLHGLVARARFVNRLVAAFGAILFALIHLWVWSNTLLYTAWGVVPLVFATIVIAAALAFDLLWGPPWVLYAIRARPLRPDESVALVEAVSSMAIATGLRPPTIWVIDSLSLNACSAAYTRRNAAIVVTSAAVETLPAEELRALVARECVRISDGGAAVGTYVSAVLLTLGFGGIRGKGAMLALTAIPVGVILCLFTAGMAGLSATLIVGYLLVLFFGGRVWQVLMSRAQQGTADVGAVLALRNPDAVMDALTRLAGSSESLSVPSAVYHLFAEHPGADIRNLIGVTHPPLDERLAKIRRVTAVPVQPSSETAAYLASDAVRVQRRVRKAVVWVAVGALGALALSTAASWMHGLDTIVPEIRVQVVSADSGELIADAELQYRLDVGRRYQVLEQKSVPTSGGEATLPQRSVPEAPAGLAWVTLRARAPGYQDRLFGGATVRADGWTPWPPRVRKVRVELAPVEAAAQ